MGKTRLAILTFGVAVLFVSLIAGTIFYCNADEAKQNREKTQGSLVNVQVMAELHAFLEGSVFPITVCNLSW